MSRVKKSRTREEDQSPERHTVAVVSSNGSASSSQSKSQKMSGWIDINKDLHVYNPGGLEGRTKVAGFDLDGTIITTKSGKIFAKDSGDWQFLFPEVPGKLKQLYQDGYKVVIFTNQGGIGKGQTKVGDWRKKVNAILAKLGIPVQVFVAPGEGMPRKPAPGMWDFFLSNYNDGVVVDKSRSVYVGDAAGRPGAGKRKKDFSCSDRLFGQNIEVKFQTPEEFFLSAKPEKFEISAFDPKKYVKEAQEGKVSLLSPATTDLSSKSQELIVLVGPPGIGKSHFAKEHLLSQNYIHINRDTLKTWQKCVAATEAGLATGKSVVVDNTNADVQSRERYIEVAKKRKIPVRCFVFIASIEHAKHNNKFRELIDASHDHVPDMVFNMWKKNYKLPTVAEGFSEVVEIKFIPSFSDKNHEKLYNMFLCEK